MALFPLFLDLAHRAVLVIGAGAVGRRKIAALLAGGAGKLTVVDPALARARAGDSLLNDPRITVLRRDFKYNDLAGMFLVIAATSDLELNAAVASLCEMRGILCNCAAPPKSGDCILPAHFHQQGLSVAVSTEGQSPALARRLREELEAFTASRYSNMLTVMGRLRPLLLELGLPSEENGQLFRALARSELPELLAGGRTEQAGELLRRLLPKALHPRVGELLHGL